MKPPHRARVVTETADAVAVCFTPPTVRWLRPGEPSKRGTIHMRRHGQPPRSVYWCPRCQDGAPPRG